MTNRVSILAIVFRLLVLVPGVDSVGLARGAVIEGWVRVYDGGSDGAFRVAVDASGNVAVTGCSAWDFYTAKYAGTTGALLWERRHDGSETTADSPTDLALDPAGNVVVTGMSSSEWYTAKY